MPARRHSRIRTRSAIMKYQWFHHCGNSSAPRESSCDEHRPAHPGLRRGNHGRSSWLPPRRRQSSPLPGFRHRGRTGALRHGRCRLADDLSAATGAGLSSGCLPSPPVCGGDPCGGRYRSRLNDNRPPASHPAIPSSGRRSSHTPTPRSRNAGKMECQKIAVRYSCRTFPHLAACRIAPSDGSTSSTTVRDLNGVQDEQAGSGGLHFYFPNARHIAGPPSFGPSGNLDVGHLAEADVKTCMDASRGRLETPRIVIETRSIALDLSFMAVFACGARRSPLSPLAPSRPMRPELQRKEHE